MSGKRIKAHGRIVAGATGSHPAFSASYDLVTDDSGATKRLSMNVTLAERDRQLSIARDEENMWSITGHQGQSRGAFDGALDVDVVFSPFFNALPIRRTGIYKCTESVTVPVVYVIVAGVCGEPGSDHLQQRIRWNQAALAGCRHHRHRRRGRFHPRLSRTGGTDLITPPALPAAASCWRQSSSPTTMPAIS